MKEKDVRNKKGYRVWVALLLGNVGGNHTVTKVLFGVCEDCVRVHAHRCAHLAQLLIKLAYMDDSLRCTPVGRDVKSWASAASAGGELGHAPISLLSNADEEFEVPVRLKHIYVHAKRAEKRKAQEKLVLAFRQRKRRKLTQTSQDLAQFTGSASAAQSVTDPLFTACSSAAAVSQVSAKLLDTALQSKKACQVLPAIRKGDFRLGSRLVKKAKQVRRMSSQDAAEGHREDVKSYGHQLRSGAIPPTKAEKMAIDVRKYANVDQPIAEKIALRKEIEKSLGYIVAVGPRGDDYTPPRNADREALWLRGYKGAISGFHSVANAKKKKQQPPCTSLGTSLGEPLGEPAQSDLSVLPSAASAVVTSPWNPWAPSPATTTVLAGIIQPTFTPAPPENMKKKAADQKANFKRNLKRKEAKAMQDVFLSAHPRLDTSVPTPAESS